MPPLSSLCLLGSPRPSHRLPQRPPRRQAAPPGPRGRLPGRAAVAAPWLAHPGLAAAAPWVAPPTSHCALRCRGAACPSPGPGAMPQCKQAPRTHAAVACGEALAPRPRSRSHFVQDIAVNGCSSTGARDLHPNNSHLSGDGESSVSVGSFCWQRSRQGPRHAHTAALDAHPNGGAKGTTRLSQHTFLMMPEAVVVPNARARSTLGCMARVS